MKLISKIIEPQRMLVVWQAPNVALKQAAGTRFIVGEIRNSGGGNTWLKYYNNQDTEAARKLGFTGLTTYPYEPDKEFNSNLVEILSKRLPPSSRTDYEDYLRSYRISPQASGISTLSLLAYTTGKLAGDGFTFLNSFEGISPPFDFTFEIAGFRHCGQKEFPNLSVLQDKEVILLPETSNQHDSGAVAVQYQGKVLGYVPKGLTDAIKNLTGQYKVSAFIERINGTPERPSVLIFVEVR